MIAVVCFVVYAVLGLAYARVIVERAREQNGFDTAGELWHSIPWERLALVWLVVGLSAIVWPLFFFLLDLPALVVPALRSWWRALDAPKPAPLACGEVIPVVFDLDAAASMCDEIAALQASPEAAEGARSCADALREIARQTKPAEGLPS